MKSSGPFFFSRKQLEAFRQATYRPDRSTLIISGKFDVAQMQKEVEQLFGAWRPTGRAARLSQTRRVAPRLPSFTAIPVSKAPTLEVAIAFASPGRHAQSEEAAYAVLNEMLAERLRVVREGLGATYGINTHVDSTSVLLHGDVEPAYAREATQAMAQEIERVRAADTTLTGDFIRAHKRVLARALAEPTGASKRAALLERVVAGGRALTDLDYDIDSLRTLSFEAVQRIAQRELKREQMVVAVRGEKSAIEAAFGALGIKPSAVEWLPERK